MSDSSRVEDILCAALEKSTAEERAAYLDEVCKESPELRRAVERLLAAHAHAGEFLEKPVSELLPTAALGASSNSVSAHNPLDLVGTSVGSYKLLEQIGEGGMGVVYMADQQAPLRRRVAMKVIKPGLDTRQVIARFEAERQALALMDHPNIARVLDAGSTDAGLPYFVMELVRGVPITDYCDANNLPIHERLELFAQVCQAVQHAHQKGIIHRDIKPSNVLVTMNDGRAVPKVIDFGVAKATNQQLTEKTLFTNFAQMVGTPLYMSPEQAEMSSLDIDTRSDIYSLGVLLYELLTGTTPFDRQLLNSAAFDEVRRIIRNQVPLLPSLRISTLGQNRTIVAAQRQADPHRLSQLVKGDLDWIVMKSLEKDRTRRYETATGLAADIKRYLLNQAVEACPPSAAYRFRKFASRNRVALTTAAMILAALLLGTVISSWQAIRATRAEHLAEAARTAEAELRQKEHAAKLLAEEQSEIAIRKTEEALASAEREKQAQQESNQQRDKGLLLALRALVQTADERISQAELLWKTGPQAKEDALEAIRTAARLRQESNDLLTAQSGLEETQLDELRTRSSDQEVRLTRIASKWLSCVALAEGPVVRAKRPYSVIVASPRGTRVAVADFESIQVLSTTGVLLARVPADQRTGKVTFRDESHLLVSNRDEHLEVIEYTIPDEPTAELLIPSGMHAARPRPMPVSHYTPPPDISGSTYSLSSDRYEVAKKETPSDKTRLYLRNKRWQPIDGLAPQNGDVALAIPNAQAWSKDRPRLLRTLTTFAPAAHCAPEFGANGKTFLYATESAIHPLGIIDLTTGLFGLASRLHPDAADEIPITKTGFGDTAPLPTIAPFEDGCFTIYDLDDEALIRRWSIVVPPYPVVQLDTGQAISALAASDSDGVSLGFANGGVARRGRQLAEKWSTDVGHIGALKFSDEFVRRNSYLFYSHLSFVGPRGELLLLRCKTDSEEGNPRERIEIRRASDGVELPFTLPNDLEFLGSAGDGRFWIYGRQSQGKHETVLFDVMTQSIVKEFEGQPENLTKLSGPKHVLPITNAAKSAIQFWKLPELILLGEVPLAVDMDREVVVDEAESCALLLQNSEPTSDEDFALFRNSTVIQFEPYSAIQFNGVLKLPPRRMSICRAPSKVGEHSLIVASIESGLGYLIKGLTSLNLKEHTAKAISCEDAIMHKSLPRFLAESKGDEGGWELFDTETMGRIQRYDGSAVSDRVSTTHFVIEDRGKSRVYRWSDGLEDPSYASFDSLEYFSDQFQIGHARDGTFCLATNENKSVMLEGLTEEQFGYFSLYTPHLSDNGATLVNHEGMWDARTGKRTAVWKTPDHWTYDPADQRVMVCVVEGGTSRVRIYDLRTGKASSEFSLDGYPTKLDRHGLKWDPASNRLAICTDRGLDLLDSSTGKLIKSISYRTHLEPVKRIAARDHLPVVLSASDGVVMEWRKEDGHFRSEVYRTNSTIADVDLSADGHSALILTVDGTVIRKSLAGEVLWQYSSGAPAQAGISARFVDGDYVLVACRDGIVRRLSAQDGKLTATCRAFEASLKAVAVAPSRKFAFLQTDRDDLYHFDVAQWSVTRSVSLGEPGNALCGVDDFTCFVGGQRLDAWSFIDCSRLWSINALGTPVLQLAFQPSEGRLIMVDIQGAGYAFRLRELSDALADFGVPPLRNFAGSRDEQIARTAVDKLFNDLIFTDEVIAAVERAPDWTDAIRTEALNYAKSRARTIDELYADAWHPLNVAEAKRTAQALCRREPQSHKFRRLLALTHWKAGEPDEALNVLGTIDPDDRTGLMIRRLAQIALGDEDAARLTSQMLRANPVLQMSISDVELADLDEYLDDVLAIVVDRGYEAYRNDDWRTAADRFSFARDVGFTAFPDLKVVGNSLAMAGKWREAADMMRSEHKRNKNSEKNPWSEAVMRAAAGDVDGYRTACAALLKSHADDPDAEPDLMLAFACSVGDRGVDNADEVVRLATKAANTAPRNSLGWTVLGAAQYRAGQIAEAVATLKKAQALSVIRQNEAPYKLPYLYAIQLTGETFLAMAYQQQGDSEALAEQLVRVKALIAQVKESLPEHRISRAALDNVVPWAVHLRLELAERELAKLEMLSTEQQ